MTSNFPRWSGDSTTPFILHLAQDLQALGWEIHVLAPHAPGSHTEEVLDGVRVERFRYLWPERLETVCYQGGALINLRQDRWNYAKLPALVVAEWSGLMRRLMGGDYDLVHSHWILPQGFTAALASKSLNIPHVLTVHGSDILALSSRLLVPFKRSALRLADAVTVNSTATREAVLRLAPGLSATYKIPMGASEPVPARSSRVTELRSRYRRGDGPMLVFVGRVVEEKGVADLIHAMSLLVKPLPNVTALIVGEGQDRQKMEALVRDLEIVDRVTFTGWVAPDLVPCHLQAADIFVGPSWIEAQGLTLIEAMLSRTPVIATRSGGITDVMYHEQTGLLVPEKSPHDIAAAVERLVADPSLVERLRASGFAVARNEFTRPASARAFSTLFERLLSTKDGRTSD
ncbi:MAG: glycosyltransferase [Rhodospirillales bacterium]|nr:glycosyltransferase [Rhodospirillales bacterium]